MLFIFLCWCWCLIIITNNCNFDESPQLCFYDTIPGGWVGGWLGGWTNIDNKANLSPAKIGLGWGWAELGNMSLYSASRGFLNYINFYEIHLRLKSFCGNDFTRWYIPTSITLNTILKNHHWILAYGSHPLHAYTKINEIFLYDWQYLWLFY